MIKIGERICLLEIWVILYPYEKHLQNTTRKSFLYDRDIDKKEEHNLHYSK